MLPHTQPHLQRKKQLPHVRPGGGEWLRETPEWRGVAVITTPGRGETNSQFKRWEPTASKCLLREMRLFVPSNLLWLSVYHTKAKKSLREQPGFHQQRWLWGLMQLMPQIGSWSTVARGCQHINPLEGAHEGQATKSPPQNLIYLSCCPMLPSLSPDPNSCPPRLFSQGPNYPNPHLLLSPFTLVFSRLLSLPSLAYNLHPLVSLDKRLRPRPHSLVKL